ncbi:MAG: AAA family ATPase [Myxococcota bacterium]
MELKKRLDTIRTELKSQFIERDTLVDGVLIGLLSRQHILILGPPGTAKSMLARHACGRLEGGDYFEWLLTKFTTPEELFGPVSLPALEAGRYERVTDGKLPRAHIAFLDEVFKANSAILNALLTLLNERTFHQGASATQVPLLSLVAASNELPEEDELEALYDRFLLRFQVGYVQHDHRFHELLQQPEPSAPATVLDRAELESLQQATAKVEIPDGIISDIVDIRRRLNAEGVIASDRRYRAAIKVLQAAATLEGRSSVAPSDLRWLQHVLWSDPEEIEKVTKALGEVMSGLEEEAEKLLHQAREVHAYAHRRWPDGESRSRATLESHTKLHDLMRRAESLREQARRRQRNTERLDKVVSEILRLQEHLLASQN